MEHLSETQTINLQHHEHQLIYLFIDRNTWNKWEVNLLTTTDIQDPMTSNMAVRKCSTSPERPLDCSLWAKVGYDWHITLAHWHRYLFVMWWMNKSKEIRAQERVGKTVWCTVDGIRVGLSETYFIVSVRMSANGREVETAAVNGSDQTLWLPTVRYH